MTFNGVINGGYFALLRAECVSC